MPKTHHPRVAHTAGVRLRANYSCVHLNISSCAECCQSAVRIDCAAGTATSPGRRWWQQQQRQQRQQRPQWQCGPRVSGRRPSSRSAERWQQTGRARSKLGPATRGPRLSTQPASPRAPPESPGSSGSGQSKRGGGHRPHRASFGAAEGPAPPSRARLLAHRLGPGDARAWPGGRATGGGEPPPPAPLGPRHPLFAQPGRET